MENKPDETTALIFAKEPKDFAITFYNNKGGKNATLHIPYANLPSAVRALSNILNFAGIGSYVTESDMEPCPPRITIAENGSEETKIN